MPKLRPLALLALLAVSAPLVALVACGGSSQPPTLAKNGGGDAGPIPVVGGGGGTAINGHAPFPTITNHGVASMTAPKIVAVTFNNDPNAAAINGYVTAVGTTSWWQAVMKDYAAGPGTGVSVAATASLKSVYTDDPSGTLADGGAPTMPGFVVSTIDGTAGMPRPDDNTVYVFFLPSTTSFEVSGASSCAGGVGGYHNSTVSGGATYIYAVVGECIGGKFGDRTFGSEINLLSFLSSHEISEAITDPTAVLSDTSFVAGWYNDFVENLTDDLAWNLVSDGEVADLCVDQFGFRDQIDTTTESSMVLQRIWSASAATAGKNPCIPIPSGEVYFNAAPAEGTDLLIVPDQNVATTIEVDAFSDAPKSWQIVALDAVQIQGGAPDLTMSFVGGTPEKEPNLSVGQLPGIAVSNGTKAQLSITVVGALSTSNPLASAFLISHDGTNLTDATSDHYWPIAVTTQSIAKAINLDAHTPVGLLRGQHRAHAARLGSALRLAR